MILIITNRQDQTADYIILELKKRKADYIRFNTEDYPQKATITWELIDKKISGSMVLPKRQIRFDEISSIWYRRPVSPQPDKSIINQETRDFIVEESRTALEGFWKTIPCFWVSHPDKIREAENKLYQLQTAIDLGFEVWPTMVTNNPTDARSFYDKHQGDIVYKPLRKGKIIRGGEQRFIFTNRVSEDISKKFNNIKYSASLLQKYIHKSIEIRVTVIGDHVFGVQIDSQVVPDAIHDWRRALDTPIRHTPYHLSEEIHKKCSLLVKKLGLQFGAIDLILTPDNRLVFLEINPNGQWAWIQQLCPEIPLRETLTDLLLKS